MTSVFVLCFAAYVVGSIPTGALVARARGIEIRAVGSGNIGATNVGRALGKRWGVLVLILDALKGFAPVFVGRRFLELAPVMVAAAGLCAVVGHMFTVFLRGRGGKGVATSLGVALALSPTAGLAGFGIYVLAYAVTRISSVGSLLGVCSFPFFAWACGVDPVYISLGGLVATLVAVRHSENIRRLIRGEEKRS